MQGPKPKHEQHHLVTHVAQFRPEDVPGLGYAAQSRRDCAVLLAPDTGLQHIGAEDRNFQNTGVSPFILGDEKEIAWFR
jgi:hypothetical protein